MMEKRSNGLEENKVVAVVVFAGESYIWPHCKKSCPRVRLNRWAGYWTPVQVISLCCSIILNKVVRDKDADDRFGKTGIRPALPMGTQEDDEDKFGRRLRVRKAVRRFGIRLLRRDTLLVPDRTQTSSMSSI